MRLPFIYVIYACDRAGEWRSRYVIIYIPHATDGALVDIMFRQPGSENPRPFRGFSSPNYTQVPDQLLDDLLPDLSEAELKVLLYIVRRTFGFKKDADTISLRQLSSGITTKEGRVLDRGTGLSKSGVTKALASLRMEGDPLDLGDTPTVLVDYVADFAREFNDQAPLRSSVSRAVNLCLSIGLGLEVFIERMYEARARTKEYTGAIRATDGGEGLFKRKSQMAYFFSILTDMVGTRVEE